MIKGILIGVGITLGVEALIALCVFFHEEIEEKFSWIFSPFFHPISALYIISVGLCPWKLSVSKILNLNDEQFEGWLKVLKKEDRKAWVELRERNR
jgi:hypothetical protein